MAFMAFIAVDGAAAFLAFFIAFMASMAFGRVGLLRPNEDLYVTSTAFSGLQWDFADLLLRQSHLWLLA